MSSIVTVRRRLHTGGRTVERVRKEEAGFGFTDKEIAAILKSEQALDGLIVELAKPETEGDGYALISWDAKDDGRVKDALYYAEQVSPFPYYMDDREKFERDWAAGEYASDCVFTINPNDVEVLEGAEG